MRRHERDAIADATLADGCLELLARLDAAGVPVRDPDPQHPRGRRELRAQVRSAPLRARWRRAGLARRPRLIIAAYTREDGPPKPAPDGVLRLCRALRVAPADALVVGDYKFDIVAGRAAGCRTALVTAEAIDDAEAWGSPDMIVRSLRQLIPLWDAELTRGATRAATTEELGQRVRELPLGHDLTAAAGARLRP